MDIQAYTQRARSVIQSAQTEAVTRDHQQLVPAHILHGLMQESGGLPQNLIQMSGAAPNAVEAAVKDVLNKRPNCLLYTSPSPRDQRGSRMPSSA